MGGVGEVGPEHQPLQGVGCPTPGNPAEGRLVRARRLHPGHARRSEGSSPGKEKDPSPRAQSCRRPGSRRAAPNFGARSRRPQPTTEFLPSDPWTPGRPAQSSAHPRRLALEPLPPTKPPPRGQSPGPLPPSPRPGSSLTKKVMGHRPPWGPGAVLSTGLTRAALQARPPEPRLVWLATTATAAAPNKQHHLPPPSS